MEKIFDKILDDDEKIVKVYKANKSKFFLSALVTSSLIFIWFVLIWVFAILFPDEGTVSRPIMVLVPIGGFILLEAIIMLFVSVYYKNLFYAYTNKRLIIRSGIFGVDFRSLDMGMIGAIDVYVSVLDKMLGKDTGTICFGSTASPMMGVKGGSYYRFTQVNDPYGTCKEIKTAIDDYKKGIKSYNKTDDTLSEVSE